MSTTGVNSFRAVFKCPKCAAEVPQPYTSAYCRPCINAYNREWRRHNNETEAQQAKRRARDLVRGRLNRGTMDRQPCEICGAEKVDAHHDDYSKPLEVRFLCRPHHRQWHKENPE